MPSLNLDTNFRDHPKTKRLVGLLGRGTDALPVWLWLYVAKHHPKTGELIGYSAQEIESIVEWRGKVGAAVEAMVKVKFLDKTKRGYRVHDWKEHAGHLWAYKLRSLAMNKAKWAKLSKPQGVTDSPARSRGGSATDSHPTQALHSQPSIPLQALPTQHRPAAAGPELGSNGAGSGSGGSGPEPGNLVGAASARGEDALAATVAKKRLLDAAGVNHAVVCELMQRRDLSPKVITREIEDIRRDPKAELPAVLVSRLRSKRYS